MHGISDADFKLLLVQSRLASAPPRLPRLDSREPFNGPLLHTSYSAAVAAAISAVDAEAAAAAAGDHLSSFGSGSLMSDTLLPANLQAAAAARPRTADAAVPPFGHALPSAPSQADRIEVSSTNLTPDVNSCQDINVPFCCLRWFLHCFGLLRS